MHLTGHIWDYLIVFSSGVVVSFTPCIYPVVPLVVSYIAAVNTKGTRLMAFVLSLVYVLGLALTYCTLAVVAALTGLIFGKVQNHPATCIVVANILFVFALIMLDVIPWPQAGMNLQGKIRPSNVLTVLLFGMTSGLVVSPCVAPVLGTLLLYTASQKNILHAVVLLFIFSYGLGASLILVGTFSGLISRMPKSGPWLARIKQVCALILFLMAEYFLVKAGRLL